MNQITYKPICSVQVFHSYFEDTLMRGLNFTPAGHFKEIIGQMGIVLKQTANGFQLFAPTDETVSSYLTQLNNTFGITAFDFDITVQDPLFYNYTDLPLDRMVSLSFSSADTQNETVGNQTILHPSLNERENSNLLGKLHIAFDDILALATNDAPIPFVISFTVRTTQWYYYFINTNSQPLDGLRIASDAGIQFSDPIDAVLPNGTKALLMTSNVLIPLSNYGKYRFNLLNNDKIIIKGLPTASPSQIGIDKSDGSQWATSSMYVYI
ncbi:MAG: hypothetical protein V7655_01170 [Aequorivita antarctica]